MANYGGDIRFPTLSPSLYQPPRDWHQDVTNLVRTLAPSVAAIAGQWMSQSRAETANDNANEQLAVMNAPRAEAVGPAVGAGLHPDIAAMIEHNRGLGYDLPTEDVSAPNLGGQAALQTELNNRMAQARIAKLQSDMELNAGLKTAQTRKANAQADGTVGGMTPFQQGSLVEKAADRKRKEQAEATRAAAASNTLRTDPTAAYADWLKKMTGLNPTQLLNPNGWKQVDEKGNPSDTGGFYASDVPDGNNHTTLAADVFGQAKSRYLQTRPRTDAPRPPSASGGPGQTPTVSPDPGLPSGGGTAPTTSLFPAAPSGADAIRAAYRAGRLSREQAAAQLQALGFQ